MMVVLGVMLFLFNIYLVFYLVWWGLLFVWLLGLWCVVLGVLFDEE